MSAGTGAVTSVTIETRAAPSRIADNTQAHRGARRRHVRRLNAGLITEGDYCCLHADTYTPDTPTPRQPDSRTLHPATMKHTPTPIPDTPTPRRISQSHSTPAQPHLSFITYVNEERHTSASSPPSHPGQRVPRAPAKASTKSPAGTRPRFLYGGGRSQKSRNTDLYGRGL